jgi:hypothetical protein
MLSLPFPFGSLENEIKYLAQEPIGRKWQNEDSLSGNLNPDRHQIMLPTCRVHHLSTKMGRRS